MVEEAIIIIMEAATEIKATTIAFMVFVMAFKVPIIALGEIIKVNLGGFS